MDIRGVRQQDMERALAIADPTGNLILDPAASSTRLRVQDSKGRFHRRSHTGRRMPSACYHGHYAFMCHLFDLAPDAVIRSSCIGQGYSLGESYWGGQRTMVYAGRDSFHDQAQPDGGMIADANCGSIMDPLRYADACDCGSEDA